MRERLVPFSIHTNLQIIILLIFLSGYYANAEQLYIYIRPKYSTIWNNFILKHKLPNDIRLVHLSTPEYGKNESFLYISKHSWSKVTKNKIQGTKLLKKTIKTVFYAPAVPFWDKRKDISMKELKVISNLQVLPLKNIRLPRKALSVNGIYPDNPDYQLKSEYSIVLHSRDTKILDWFRGINNITDKYKIVWVESVGDTMLARGVDSALLKKGGVSFIFGNTLTVLNNCDFLIGNLECVASLKGKKAKKRYHFHFNPQALKKVRKAGFGYFALANNHSLDYGFTGFLDALKNLKRAGIGFSGVGKNLTQASQTFIKSIKGENLQVFSAGAYPVESSGFDGRHFTARNEAPGILWADKYFMQELSLKCSKSTFDIVMIHGGREWTTVPTESQKKLYRSLVDHGADLVIGSHPHYLQGMEVYKNKLIAYSLGNFIFPGMDGTRYGQDSIILRTGIYRGNILYLEIYPVLINGKQIRLTTDGTIKNRFLRLTRALR